jgi:para-aminobenzoate synthetase component 1
MSPLKPAKRVQTAYLGLGGNVGDRRALISEALARLAASPEVRIARVSPVYETAAVVLPGAPAQPDFLNLVVEVETTLSPHALLEACLSIEQHLGRIRRERWGARTIDLDILLFGHDVSADARLTLPHPRLHERAFVLAPLAELVPSLVVNGSAVGEHLARVDRTGVTLRADLALAPPVLLEEVTLPCPPHEFFARLADRDHAFFLDSGLSSGGLGAYSFLGFAPFQVLRAKDNLLTLTPEIEPKCNPFGYGSPLAALQELLRRYRSAKPICYLASDNGAHVCTVPALPFTGGAIGFFGYELCTRLEKLPRSRPDDLPAVPDCEFAFYDSFIAHEHASGRTWLVANPVATTPAATLLAQLRTVVTSHAAPSKAHPTDQHVGPPRANATPVANFDFSAYTEAIGRIKRYIAAGDVYQVNLTQRFATPLPCEPYALYQRLRARSPAPFASFLSFGPVQIVSSSPERFLTLRNRRIETRPIKGTRPRSADSAVDARLAGELLASEKDRAELLMIVDLERNDLGRVCEFGSVQVENLWRLESHPTVHHLVATVSGTLRDGLDIIDCVRATFPGGSITGAPKIRSMEIIDELEPHRRHVYTGAIGYINFDGDADLNIAIRTITCANGHAYYHVGGGIVWDSDPASEYQETLDKGRAMHEALTC